MSDEESLREDGRIEAAERRARRVRATPRDLTRWEEPPNRDEPAIGDAEQEFGVSPARELFAEWAWWQELKKIWREMTAPL